MYRLIAVLFLFFVSPSLADAILKSYQFGECLGHETICDDEFNEVIILSVNDGGAIATDIQFNHPHIVEISADKMTLDGDGFYSAHSIINNLGHEFTFEITGNAVSAVAEAVIIHLGQEQLASIKLTAINLDKAEGPEQSKPEKYMAQYSSCADANGPLNNSVVYLCADKVIEIAQRDAEEKISSLRRTNLKQDIEVLLEAQELWAAYVQRQCELQGKYVGSPMVSYCPMLKWIARNEELDLLLGSLSVN